MKLNVTEAHEVLWVHILLNEIKVKVNVRIAFCLSVFAFFISSQLFLIWSCICNNLLLK